MPPIVTEVHVIDEYVPLAVVGGAAKNKPSPSYSQSKPHGALAQLSMVILTEKSYVPGASHGPQLSGVSPH